MNCLHFKPQIMQSLRQMVYSVGQRCRQLPDHQLVRHFNANRSAVSKISRTKYCRLYRVLMVYPDGSTITCRHPEPQSIVQIPTLLDDCQTEADRRQWLSRRKRIETLKTEDEIQIKYNQNQYLHLFKSKSRAH